MPPFDYQRLYDVTQEAIYHYSKAWSSLDRYAFEKGKDKTKLGAEALVHFQRGNELFSIAGVLLEKVAE